MNTLGIQLPFSMCWWFYLVFSLVIVGLVFFDLYVSRHSHQAPSVRSAIYWSVFWVFLASIFSVFFYFFLISHFTSRNFPNAEAMAWAGFMEFITGYVVEKMLAVDNLFVFIIIFKYLNIPTSKQHRVLAWGILGALVFRALLIGVGSQLFEIMWVRYIFSLLLVFAGISMFFSHQEKQTPPKLLLYAEKYLPVRLQDNHDRYWVFEKGKFFLTSLGVALLAIECTDVIFALDSIPAVFAITDEPFIVYTSNMFAILGLRALYGVLTSGIGRFQYLPMGVGAILIFVGAKMGFIDHWFGGKFPIGWSLCLMVCVLLLSVGLSIRKRMPEN